MTGAQFAWQTKSSDSQSSKAQTLRGTTVSMPQHLSTQPQFDCVSGVCSHFPLLYSHNHVHHNTVPLHRFLLLQCNTRVDDNHKEIRGKYSRCFRPEPGYGRDYSKHSPVKPQIKLVDPHITDKEANYLVDERHTYLLIRYSRNVDAARDGNTLALLLSLFIRRIDKTHYLAA